MTEHDLQSIIQLALSELGFMSFHFNPGEGLTRDGRQFKTGVPKGWSDLIAFKKGKTYFIEVKIRPNKPTLEQLNFISRMREEGYRAGIAYNIEDALVICGLNAMGGDYLPPAPLEDK